MAEDGTLDTSQTNPITREDKVHKARVILGMEAGIMAAMDADDELLASLGYRAELKREFSYLTVFGQSFGAMGIAPAIAESIIFSLGSAGSPGMVWAYLVGCILLMPVALSLGELGSSMPTSGGLYYVSTSRPWDQQKTHKLYAVGCAALPFTTESFYVLACVRPLVT
jgi:amino acid permease